MQTHDEARPCREAAEIITPYMYWLPTAYTASSVATGQQTHIYRYRGEQLL